MGVDAVVFRPGGDDDMPGDVLAEARIGNVAMAGFLRRWAQDLPAASALRRVIEGGMGVGAVVPRDHHAALRLDLRAACDHGDSDVRAFGEGLLRLLEVAEANGSVISFT